MILETGFSARPRVLCLPAIFLFLSLSMSSMLGQYQEHRSYEPSDARFIHAGFVQRDFTPRLSNTAPDSLVISYDRSMPMIGFRQQQFDIAFGYTKFRHSGISRETIFFSVSFANEFVISGKKPSTLLFPLVVSTDFSKAEGRGVQGNTFNVVSAGVGGGLKYRYASDDADFSIHAFEIVHFSFEGLSTGSGFSAATVAEASLLLPTVRVLDGIALGYRFRFQTWSMSNRHFNYRSVSHGPYFGIML